MASLLARPLAMPLLVIAVVFGGAHTVAFVSRADPMRVFRGSVDEPAAVYMRYYGTQERCDLYLLDADGRQEERLVHADIDQRYPAWSPGGTRVAFVGSLQQGQSQVFSVGVDGNGLQQHTAFADRMVIRSPRTDLAWSPEGRWLLLTTTPLEDREQPLCELTLLDMESGAVHILPHPDGVTTMSFGACWMPDADPGAGYRGGLLFTATEAPLEHKRDLYRLPLTITADQEIDCGAPVNLTHTVEVRESEPHLSADGRTLVFVADSHRICVLDLQAPGARPRTIYGSDDWLYSPRWSPDGEKILFTTCVAASRNDGEVGVHLALLNADGSNLQSRETGRNCFERRAEWRPGTSRLDL